MSEPRVKICGLMRSEDARIAAEAGADYVGTILSPGFSRSVEIPTAQAVAHAAGLPLVAVFVDPRLEDAVSVAQAAGASVVQLHGDETPELATLLRDRGPWRVWKAKQIRSAEDAESALELFRYAADALLLDGWDPDLRGGAGVRFPWDRLAAVRRQFAPDLEFVAAGGLTPDNVSEAVSTLLPDVVDVSSGVELELGVKDPEKVRRFVERARAGGTGT